MDSLFAQLSLVLGIAAIISILMRLMRQPLIIGYILTGLLAGPSFLNIVKDHAGFTTFSQIGITLLLFIVGLGLNTSLIKSTGRPALSVFLADTAVLVAAGFGIGALFHFQPVESLLLGIGLVFSSTIVVIKTLTDNREQNRLHGRLIIGVLLIEDLAATAVLVFLASTGKAEEGASIAALAVRGILLILALITAGWLLGRWVQFLARSQELLFGFALAWAFAVAFVFDAAGFSIEIGALFAGVSLASLPYAQEIGNRLKPLRDFFLLLFFVTMGERLTLHGITTALLPAVCCALVVTFLKPFAAANTLGIMKYTKQTAFKVSAHLSQISEFSIVMIILAHNKGLVGTEAVTVITLTALITIITSTYLIHYDGAIFRRLQRTLPIIERPLLQPRAGKTPDYTMVLFGYRRGGHEFVRTFRSMKKPYVVVDYNPEIVESLEQQHVPVIYGDATDHELLEEIGLRQAELVVSVLPGTSNNLVLIQYLRMHNPDCIFICHANDYDDAAMYYDAGVSYVMLPHFIGSERMSAFIKKHGTSRTAFELYRKQHLVSIGKAALD